MFPINFPYIRAKSSIKKGSTNKFLTITAHYDTVSHNKKSLHIDENSKIEAKVETLVETNETRKLFGFESSDFFVSDKQFGGSDE